MNSCVFGRVAQKWASGSALDLLHVLGSTRNGLMTAAPTPTSTCARGASMMVVHTSSRKGSSLQDQAGRSKIRSLRIYPQENTHRIFQIPGIPRISTKSGNVKEFWNFLKFQTFQKVQEFKESVEFLECLKIIRIRNSLWVFSANSEKSLTSRFSGNAGKSINSRNPVLLDFRECQDS